MQPVSYSERPASLWVPKGPCQARQAPSSDGGAKLPALACRRGRAQDGFMRTLSAQPISRFRRLLQLIAVLAITAMPVAARAQSQTSTDQSIQAAIVRTLQNEKLRRGNNPDVSVTSGVARLTGQAQTLWEKEAIITAVRKTAGVTETLSELTIPRAESDRALADALGKGVFGYTQYSVFDDINLRVQNGAVTFEGLVTDGSKIDDLGEIAARTRGVQSLQNNLKMYVASQSDDRLRYTLANRIFGSPNLQQYGQTRTPSIHIVVERAEVTLKGYVNSALDKQQIDAIVRQTPGILKVTDELQVAP
jgi:osmotically-inducible protein OsmY